MQKLVRDFAFLFSTAWTLVLLRRVHPCIQDSALVPAFKGGGHIYLVVISLFLSFFPQHNVAYYQIYACALDTVLITET
jgi:hypothetical protein